MADQHEAILTYLSRGRTRKTVTLTSTDYPWHQQTGGWSQARLQRRAEERVKAFAKDVAAETRKSLERTGIEALIVAGNELMTTALDHEFHASVKERIVDTNRLDITANDDGIIEATQGIAERAERDRDRDREAYLVQMIQDQIGSDARGVGGPDDTLLALETDADIDIIHPDILLTRTTRFGIQIPICQ